MVPAALSISYLTGSPPTGTSTITLTSWGGLWPIGTASTRIDAPVFEESNRQQATGGGQQETPIHLCCHIASAPASCCLIVSESPRGPQSSPSRLALSRAA